MKNRKKSFFIISGIILVLLISFFFKRLKDHPEKIVNKTEVDDNFITSQGTISANESVNIKPTVRERIVEIFFQDGDEVEKGQILLTLNNEEENALRSEAQAVFDEQVLQYNRIQYLVKRKASSQAQLEEEEGLMKIARAKLDNIEARLREFKIRAPFAGVLGIRYVSPGAVVDKDTIITTLDDISSVKLDFQIPETLISSIRPGMKVTVLRKALSEKSFEGKITMISSRINQESKTLNVRAVIPNQDYILKPGMSVIVKLANKHKL
ncbi:Efflux transporter, RND family [Desulfonema limicola]|uniref:Efflux transporter, RND family n=1 Tax=Desulfonema limicola TaxID=45656 RepID=A0A975GHY8_9BACT|nr:efflux RND transporter periplasmic adaptor subunit [Desulfonema limicola]QTA81854.1 Efflux transporter, RND family [Desulfonema limicola]